MKQRAIIATLIAPLLVLICLPAVAYAEPACTPDNGVTVADTFLGSYSCNGVLNCLSFSLFSYGLRCYNLWYVSS